MTTHVKTMWRRRDRLTGHYLLLWALLVLAAACGGEPAGSPSDRGSGLELARLSADRRAAAYDAALHGAFDFGPSLVLLLDPDVLPRQRSAASSETLPADVVKALRARGAIQGICRAQAVSPRVTPICPATVPGYEVQFSDIFRVARDTVQLYVAAQQYRPSHDTTGYRPPLQFEQRYTLAATRRGWTITREERLTH